MCIKFSQLELDGIYSFLDPCQPVPKFCTTDCTISILNLTKKVQISLFPVFPEPLSEHIIFVSPPLQEYYLGIVVNPTGLAHIA
jgi:hypothetical protein